MENKKKPSVLRLINSKDDFESEGTLFRPEMLKWPFFMNNGYILYRPKKILDVENEYIKTHRKVLEALTNIYPFETKISIDVNEELQILFFCGSTWAKIYLDGQCVLSLSHYLTETYLRKKNEPYHSLLDWPEINAYSEEYIGIYAETFFDKIDIILSKWSVEDWRLFFKKRLLERAGILTNKAEAKMKDAQALHKTAFDLLHVLSPFF